MNIAYASLVLRERKIIVEYHLHSTESGWDVYWDFIDPIDVTAMGSDLSDLEDANVHDQLVQLVRKTMIQTTDPEKEVCTNCSFWRATDIPQILALSGVLWGRCRYQDRPKLVAAGLLHEGIHAESPIYTQDNFGCNRFTQKTPARLHRVKP